MSISSIIRQDREYAGVYAALSEQLASKNAKALPLAVHGLSGGSLDAFLAQCVKDSRNLSKSPVLILAENEESAENLRAELLNDGLSVMCYPNRDYVFHKMTASHGSERERLSVLFSVSSGTVDCVIATPDAALSYTVPEERLIALSFSLKIGDILSPEELSRKLSAQGYVKVDMVESAGQFAGRGGIVDVFTADNASPIRIEFFGDEVDRMGYFHPDTQRVYASVESFTFLPGLEVLPDAEAKARILRYIETRMQKCKTEEGKRRLLGEAEILKADLPIPFLDKYLSLVYPTPANLLSYMNISRRTVVFVLGYGGLFESLKKKLDVLKTAGEFLIAEGSLTAEVCAVTGDQNDLSSFFDGNLPIYLDTFSTGHGTERLGGLFQFRARSTVFYGDNATMLHEDLLNYRKSGYKTLVLSENKAGATSLYSSLMNAGIGCVPIYENPNFDYNHLQNGGIYLAVDSISVGFDLLTPKIAVLSLRQSRGSAVLAHKRHQRILKSVGGAGERLLSFSDLSVGDYVVHRHYGIGLFEGISSVRVDGTVRDYITLRYAGTDKLFIPCENLDMIGKYIGARDKDGTVKLSHMGGGDWNRTKSRAKAAVRDIAKDLILLYAERQRRPGHAFPPDSVMETEFAESFPFEDTESQTKAIEEIKADMMRPVPMNRLLCGDVGFGKTEVALRAAFKAILDGKQVAFLVPTTILALQHFETALSRMRGYPISVEMLSRFRSAKAQAEILRRLKRHDIDLLIGTHKLLSSKVEFADLGLLIVDEEQRFGVSQKEKLKQIAKNVDVLTLTATPIPRTLHMAMNGISDMSVLDEAPVDRRPVQTYVLEHDEAVIYDAVRRELGRGGQVLYLYNKVEHIVDKAGQLTEAFPMARVAYAHGQMEHDELEDIWDSLVRGEIDVLVCTTIIETGVDLPNANTLIIENADTLGLSQLHQLRGRVGRSPRQAYAYFTYRKGKALTEVGQKRLSAIREYAEFGAGFQIALRDLEIRGAGNLLGAEQHGYMDSVGYDLYVRLLEEAVLEEQGKTPEIPFASVVEIKTDAHISVEYVATDAARIEMYKKISRIKTREDKMDVTDEFLDRYGDIPLPTVHLIDVSYLRALASYAKVKRVEEKDGFMRLVLDKADLATWSEVFPKHMGLYFAPGDPPTVAYRLPKGKDSLTTAIAVLEDYKKSKEEER